MTLRRAVLVVVLALGAAGCAAEPAPTVVMTGATQVTADQRHACGVGGDGTVRCWGANLYGQLGDGTTEDAAVASRPVVGVQDATAVSAGHDFTCAVLGDGTVRCWGYNLSGQLGDGTSENIAMESRRVVGMDDATAVAAGGNHACAVVAAGAVECWGGNEFGQLGDGTTEDRTTPRPVPGLRGVTSLSAGDGSTCAVLGDGTVRCWGVNGLGQLGGGEQDRTTPAAVSGLGEVEAVASGLLGSCAVTERGPLRCWGGVDPVVGGTGSGRVPGPRRVPDTDGATSVVVGERRWCAVDARGRPLCWSEDRHPVAPDWAVDEAPASSVALWGRQLCLVSRDRSVWCGPST